MGSIVKKVPKQQYQYETDWELVAKVFFGALGFIVLAMISVGIAWHLTRALIRKPAAPPKVVTKIVHESALTANQREFTKQCEADSQYVNQETVHGVPDVHTSNWTCVYPKSQ